MYCPRCATAVSEDKRYCPTCGLELSTVTEIVAGRFVAEPAAEDRRTWLVRWGTLLALLSLMLGCLIPIAVGLEHYFPFDETLYALLGGLAGLALFGGGGMIVYGESLPKSRGAGKPRASALPEPLTASALPPARPPVPVSSVTEHTTRPLKRRKR